MKSFFRLLLVSVMSLGAIVVAHAQKDSSLPDPTRPPVTASEPVSATSDNVPTASGLQTIILGKGHKPMAVINGVMVELGDKIGDATLVKLNESEAVLQGPAGTEILHLMPGAVKKTSSSGSKKDDGLNHDK